MHHSTVPNNRGSDKLPPKPLSYRTFHFAGWLSMLSAFISIPLSYVAYLIETRQTDSLVLLGYQLNPEYSNLILTVVQIGGTLLFSAILLYLKTLLSRVLKFQSVNRNIDLMILANITIGIFSVSSLYLPQIKEPAGMATLILTVFMGMVQIQFGYKLLRLPITLGGLLKPFCLLNIATGVCEASLVLILVGVVVSAVGDLMLGTIFFNVSKQLKQLKSVEIAVR